MPEHEWCFVGPRLRGRRVLRFLTEYWPIVPTDHDESEDARDYMR